MTTNMNIASVKLINFGKKGIVVTYSSPYTCKDATSMDALKHTRKFPIHLELENGFKALRNILLDVCDYSKENREKDIQDTTVEEIIYNNESFSIKGTKCILDSDKTIPLCPKNITADDYADYDDVVDILNSIYKETKAYMAGEKEISDEQLVLSFNEGKEDFDSESFKNLSPEEKRDICTALLEAQGHVVIHTEEMGKEADASEDNLEVPEPAIEATMDVVQDDDNFDLPQKTEMQKPSKSDKKSLLKLVDGEGGSFKIVATEPEKQSTAKKIKVG